MTPQDTTPTPIPDWAQKAIPDTRSLAQKAAAADYDADRFECIGEWPTARFYRAKAAEFRKAAGIKERDPWNEPRDWSVPL